MTEEQDEPEILPPEIRTAATELIWRCGNCGYQRPRAEGPPDRCPDCDAPREEFYVVTED
jgi:rubrerythrin